MARVGVAISGGGHRAALFGLGALMYLADAEKSREVVSISSVSGGSITNGYVALRTDYSRADGKAFQEVAGPLARQIAKRGTVMAVWTTWAYLGLLAIGLVGVALVWLLDLHWVLRLLIFLLALLVWATLAEQRGRICGLAFAKTLYSVPGHPPRLRDVHPARLRDIYARVDHVLCATDLHAGEHVYFSGQFVCSYRFGWGKPADLALHTAVQCSAALPGVFPARWLRTRPHGFTNGNHPDKVMALVDGGVYDNMADQWGSDVTGRKARWRGLADGLQEPEELVVINASGGMGWAQVGSLRMPLLGEILSLLRAKDVLYDNSTSLRREGLVGRFDRAELLGKGLRGVLVHIPQSPFYVPRNFERSAHWPQRAGRAKVVLDALKGESETEWEGLTRASGRVRTGLSRLGPERSANLLRHGYVLAMANCHVILGYPLVAMPGREQFLGMVT